MRGRGEGGQLPLHGGRELGLEAAIGHRLDGDAHEVAAVVMAGVAQARLGGHRAGAVRARRAQRRHAFGAGLTRPTVWHSSSCWSGSSPMASDSARASNQARITVARPFAAQYR